MLNTTGLPLVYVAKAPTVSNVIRQAVMVGLNCIPQAPGPIFGVPFLPNHPSVTGVSEPDFSPPLRLEVVPLSALNDIFNDGFESQPAQTWRLSSLPA